MRSARLICAALGAAQFIWSSAGARGAAQHAPRLGLINQDGVPVRSQPSWNARILTVLVQQSQVEVLGSRSGRWHVKFWAIIGGWVPKADVVFRRPWSTSSTYQPPEIHYQVHTRPAVAIHASATVLDHTLVPWNGASPAPHQGGHVVVSAWRQDGAGRVWYRVSTSWVRGTELRFDVPDPGRATESGTPLWARISGKGMWMVLGAATTGSADSVVRAAMADGITHLYVESAISPLGFHGRDSVGPLIDDAHRHHIAVIAWVYPYLYDIGSDVALTRAVARFQTPSGQRFDGIAEDIERNMSRTTIRDYSQLVRAYLGDKYLLVGVTYPPQSLPNFPFDEVSHFCNAMAPMDYWHQTQTENGLDYGHMRYGYAYGCRYATDSIARMRREGVAVPIAPIGQTFDDFGRLAMGTNAPSAEEVRGFLAGVKASGAMGVSFFQWTSATEGEWRAIHDFRL